MVVHNTSLSSSVPLRVGCDRWSICIWNHHWADPNLLGRNLTICPEVEQPPIVNNHESKPLPEKSELQTKLQAMKTKNFIITIPPLLSFYRTPDASRNPCQIIQVISDIHRRTVSFLGPPRANLLHEQSYSASHWLGFCWVLGIYFSGKSILNTTSVTKSSVNLNPYLHQPTTKLQPNECGTTHAFCQCFPTPRLSNSEGRSSPRCSISIHWYTSLAAPRRWLLP